MRIDLDQMCVYDKVAKYIIEAECREPLHIGTGNGENGEVLIHPEENRPFVQAAGIAGAFREFYQYDEALQTRLFGSPYRGSEEKGSRVFFTDGFFGESSVYTEIRPRLRIDRRTATGQSVRTKGSDRRSGQKFEIESVAAGSRFSFAVYLYQKEEKLEKELERGLKALQEGRIQLGGQKSNGCGYVSLHSVKKAVYNFYSAEDRKLWAGETKDTEEILPEILESGESGEERLCFELTGHTEGGILVKSIAVTEYGENVPDAVNIRNHQRAYILPASSVKGVLRSQIEKIAAYKNTVSAVSDLFGQEHGDSQEGRAGKIRCFDCVIGDEKANDQAPVQCRIHIDKFTGGVMYGGLFSEKPAYGKLTVRVELDGGCDRESGLVLMALRDLAIGIVPMGSGSSIGRGFLKGEKLTVKRGSRVLAVIDCENGRTEDGSQYMEQCLKALEQAGEG
ncbi:MAG: hypothetical protein HFG74_09105 [Hungatella sp.]|nr:hypothetical protein [Hungatella sp.]